jgi:DNA processing protein
MVNDAIPLLQLMQTKGLGPRSIARLLGQLSEANISLSEFVDLPLADLRARSGFTDEQARDVSTNQENAVALAERLEHQGIRCALRGHPDYPARLSATLADRAPPALFLAGNVGLIHRRGVGFCGARNASDEAIRCAGQIAGGLARHGLLVVSGHAKGVDETAHRAALEADGQTALVLPEGILHFRSRPSLSELLSEDNFVAISEFPPKLPWSVANAMQRNRTICGLVHALVVIEARTTGGTWEAGLTALDLGIPLFILEYSSPSPSGLGNPLLLKKGGVPLPCHPGELPDLTRLLQSLELPVSKKGDAQYSLFDRLTDEA